MRSLRKNLRSVILLVIGQAAPVVFAQEFVPVFEDDTAPQQQQQSVDVVTENLKVESAKLTFKAESSAMNSRILFADIGTCEGEKYFCEEVANIDFGSSAAPGDKKNITDTDIKQIIAKEFPSEKIEIVSPQKVVVRTMSQEIDKLQLEAVLQDLLDSKFKHLGDLRVKFARVLFAKKMRISPGDYFIEIPAIADISSDDYEAIGEQLAGRKILEFTCAYGSGLSKRIEHFKVSAHVEFERLLPVVRTTKAQGSVLAHEDLDLKWLPMTRLNAEAISDVKNLVGKNIKTAIHAGQFVSPKSLATVALVKRGSSVRVMITGPGINLSGEAKAMASGGMGESIKVFYAATKKSLLAKIVGENLVEVGL